MKSRDFCYWLQGYFELQKPETMNAEQVNIVRAHLNMVFKHEIDPSFGNEEKQDILKRLHDAEAAVKKHDNELLPSRRITC